ncbi:hypothetical protein SteCoe_11594 [Stentor coeruleus]|uniref:Uncharacterized protein n=1 Tax=Stentor coeruleus TaxID=5963 RepID=A0A1R2CCT6_9CILI|nr:hypothetical protein SteCoe_11594 [Stentor coeruleus]
MIQQFGESLENRWYHEHSIKIHKKHLDDIKKRSKSTIRSPIYKHISVNLRKLSQEVDKQKEIDRENFILFMKLSQIKERKTNQSENYGPKSLNFSQRKKEAEKIMTENYDYVKRFIEKPSYLSAKRHENEFKIQQGYKKTISKASLHKRLVKLASVEGRYGHIPPLESYSLENIHKHRSEDPSKLEDIQVKDSETSLSPKVSEKEVMSENNPEVYSEKNQEKKQNFVVNGEVRMNHAKATDHSEVSSNIIDEKAYSIGKSESSPLKVLNSFEKPVLVPEKPAGQPKNPQSKHRILKTSEKNDPKPQEESKIEGQPKKETDNVESSISVEINTIEKNPLIENLNVSSLEKPKETIEENINIEVKVKVEKIIKEEITPEEDSSAKPVVIEKDIEEINEEIEGGF